MATKKEESMYNVKNVTVCKDKNSDFLDFYQEHLKGCMIARILPVGNYYIYTLDKVFDAQRKKIKDNQDSWV